MSKILALGSKLVPQAAFTIYRYAGKLKGWLACRGGASCARRPRSPAIARRAIAISRGSLGNHAWNQIYLHERPVRNWRGPISQIVRRAVRP
eukprot:6193344-Pleurochrysis_carterae.AAC.2